MSSLPVGLQEIVRKAALRARGSSLSRISKKSLAKPAAKWVSQSRIGCEVGHALSVVLATQGCSHARGGSGGCTMCSYLLDGASEMVSTENIVVQFQDAMTSLEGLMSPISLKVYTSGSFLDPDEVPLEARSEILKVIAEDERIHQVVLESRPEYVTGEAAGFVREILGDKEIEMAIGLESIDDGVRNLCINKGFSLSEFKTALRTAAVHDIGTRAYVLIKPPFLTEHDALLDSTRTIIDAAKMGATTVSVNPVNVQKHTLVERMWSRGAYRPPWLWTVTEVLRQSRVQVSSEVNIVCDPVAAGKYRGTHNCGKCDDAFVKSIRQFSLDQSPRHFEGLDCECRYQWMHTLEHEDFAHLVHSSAAIYLGKPLRET
ncbi:MAG: archaeosine biosynthesis radical SAM protein RaSEA [Candidatus Thorarchaeota archaeon]